MSSEDEFKDCVEHDEFYDQPEPDEDGNTP